MGEFEVYPDIRHCKEITDEELRNSLPSFVLI